MPKSKINSFLGLPELKLVKESQTAKNSITLHFVKTSKMEDGIWVVSF